MVTEEQRRASLERFVDNCVDFTKPHPQATTWPWLLKDLGVTDAPLDEQIATVKVWLRSHEPSAMIKIDLDELGIPY